MKNIEKIFEIAEIRQLTYKTFLIRLKGNTREITRPGQFVNIAIPGKYLRRPISVCDYKEGEMVLVFDVVGEGTKELSRMKRGEKLNILTGLGNGFSINENVERPLLLGGGIGCPPLFNLAKTLKRKGKDPIVILGFNKKDDSFGMEHWLKDEGIETYVATVDGSYGFKGFVTDVIKQQNIVADYFHACGPMPMLKALCLNLDISGEVSIESRMGCGFGICVCCSVETRNGAKRICKEGPVFGKEELIWK